MLFFIAGTPEVLIESPNITGIASQPLIIGFVIARDYPFPLSNGGIAWNLVKTSENQSLSNSTELYFSSPSTLIIPSLQLRHEGTYVLTVTNAFGSATASVPVTVLGLCSTYSYVCSGTIQLRIHQD